jgi:hypothetical protein
VEHEQVWWEFYIMLAVALDLDERRQFWEYVLAGGKPEKWKWHGEDQAGTRTTRGRFWNKLKRRFGGVSGDISHIADHMGFKEVSKITERMPDGEVRVRYVDGDGNDVDPGIAEGFMRSKRLEQEQAGE